MRRLKRFLILIRITKMYIHVEGNIGAGKSTFLRYIEENTDFNVSQEPVDEWMNIKGEDNKSLLETFYEDIPRWSFAFQMNCFITRVHNVKKMPRTSVNFIERSILSDRIFAKNCYENDTMTKIEFDIYTRWSEWLKDKLCDNIDAIIYLRTTPDVSDERIDKRSRNGESNIPMDYLKQLHNHHDKWLLNEKGIPVLVLDANTIKYDENLIKTITNFVKIN